MEIRKILNNILKTGEATLILCKNPRHKAVLRTTLSRERVKMLSSPETRHLARKITSSIIIIDKKVYLKISLKESLKTFVFGEDGSLLEINPERSKIDQKAEKE